jgi:phosphoribosylformylglycinamidine cyclo-ligase
VSDGCLTAKSALLGGETAIMPDLYSPGEFDMAGFSVGVVERDAVVDGKKIAPGDVVLGIPSSGLHSNGYSLVRKVVFEAAGMRIDDPVPELEATVAEVLLEPTRIYADAVASMMKNDAIRPAVHGMAHITGGGIADNIERVIPEGVDCMIRLHRGSWPVPSVFGWLQNLGPVADDEMSHVFNMGLGFAVIVGPDAAEEAQAVLKQAGAESNVIGRVIEGPRGVEWRG